MIVVIGLVISCIVVLIALGLLLCDEYWPAFSAWFDDLIGEIDVIVDDVDVENWS